MIAVPVFWLPRGSGLFLEGWYAERGSRMYVSRGIGTTSCRFDFVALASWRSSRSGPEPQRKHLLEEVQVTL